MRVLCRTAFNSMTVHDVQFSAATLEHWESEWTDKVDAPLFLSYIWKISNLLEPGSDRSTWRFRSRTIRDVLCAKYLVERTDDLLQLAPPPGHDDDLPSVWRYACEISQDATPVISALVRCAVRPEVRAAVLMSVLVGNASIKKSLLREARKSLINDLLSIANDLRSDSGEVPHEQHCVLLRLQNPKPHSFLDRIGDIVSTAVAGGVPSGRAELAKALIHDKNWLLQRTGRWLAEQGWSVPLVVVVSHDSVCVRSALPVLPASAQQSKKT
jgi:hypothetical protein